MRGRESGFGPRDWGLGTWIAFVMLLGCELGVASPQRGGDEGRLRITVRVHDYAQVAPKILEQAKREATTILDETGVESIWADCPPGGRPGDEVCTQAYTATDLVLRILPQAMAAHVQLNGDTFGFAAVSTDERPSFAASIFYHRAKDLSHNLGYSCAATLGYVMAHEIGHLLLGTNSHSPFGIMRARLTREDLLRPLSFSTTQAEHIRIEVRRRNTVAASVEAPQTAQAPRR